MRCETARRKAWPRPSRSPRRPHEPHSTTGPQPCRRSHNGCSNRLTRARASSRSCRSASRAGCHEPLRIGHLAAVSGNGTLLDRVGPDAMTAARQPQQDRSRATRARLLAAAITCLADLGYHASTVAVVAEQAGVSRGAAQHHFPTRDALFTAALEHVTRVRAEELRRELGAVPGKRPATAEVVELTFSLFTGPLFHAALTLWAVSYT